MQRSKTLPKGAATFLADCLARDSYLLTQHNRDDVAAELLGIDRAAVPTAVSELPAGSDNRALVIALALVLGSLEARTGKDAWRNPAPVRDPSALLTQRGWVPGRYVTTLVPEHSERSGHSPAKSGHDCSANEISQEPVEPARIFQGKKMRAALAGFEDLKVCPRGSSQRSTARQSRARCWRGRRRPAWAT